MVYSAEDQADDHKPNVINVFLCVGRLPKSDNKTPKLCLEINYRLI